MLQEMNGGIYEGAMTVSNMNWDTTTGGSTGLTGGSLTTTACWQPYTWYSSYPVYICTDKTKKAIDVLKTLQAEKLLKCESVPKFIALVEKIAAIL